MSDYDSDLEMVGSELSHPEGFNVVPDNTKLKFKIVGNSEFSYILKKDKTLPYCVTLKGTSFQTHDFCILIFRSLF